MSSYYDEEGLDNSAYHNSETLEIDRGQHGRVSPQRNSSFRPNPYDTYEDQHERRERMIADPSDNIPMSTMHPRMETSQHNSRAAIQNANPYGSGYYNPAFENDSDYASRPPSINDDRDVNSGFYSQRPLGKTEDGNETLLRRRNNQQSTLPAVLMNDSNLARANSFLEQETALYIKKLAEMSENERIKEIQKLPIVMKRKQALRNKVQEVKSKKSKKGGGQINCCTECMYTTALSFRRAKEVLLDGLQALRLWRKTLKSIGAKFGTSILSYFTFLKWLLTFNIFSFVVNFSFITIPQLLEGGPNSYNFSGLEILSGAGYFQDTVLYYGFYTNSTIQKSVNLAAYNMQLAYIFTIGFYLVICFLCLVYSMAKSFRENFINPNAYSAHATKLLCAWDFSVTNEKAIKHRQKNLSTQVKEALSELLQVKVKLTIGQRIAAFLIHVLGWALSMGTAAGCCAAVYFLSKDNLMKLQTTSSSDLDRQGASLILPVVVAVINMVMPFIYSLFGHVEKFKNPRHEIYVLILRNVFLKISIIGVLCYYWLEVVAEYNTQKNSEADLKCWETLVGADIYRLIMFDFLFCLLGSFFGEFLRRIIGTKCFKSLGMPEFDIARNVLDLIYAQTLAWIGIYFSPLLPVIQILKLFIIFYVKKVSLMMNCVPPRRAWRASQMTTVFIFLLFFPSFTGVLSVVGVTVWSRNSSTICGPFRNLDRPFSAISTWVATISDTPNLQWVVWIYHNFIESALFFFLLTLIVLIISYLYWQIIQGRKIMVKLLQEQIANEGKKKMFLLEELTQLQKKPSGKDANYSASNGRPFAEPQYAYRFQEPNQFYRGSEMQHPNMREGVSEALAIAMRAKQQADLEEGPPPCMRGGGSEALAIAMEARQQAESKGHPLPALKEFGSDGLQLAMRARQQAELEEHQPHLEEGHPGPWEPALSTRHPDSSDGSPPGGTSNALAIAMRARANAGTQEY